LHRSWQAPLPLDQQSLHLFVAQPQHGKSLLLRPRQFLAECFQLFRVPLQQTLQQILKCCGYFGRRLPRSCFGEYIALLFGLLSRLADPGPQEPDGARRCQLQKPGRSLAHCHDSPPEHLDSLAPTFGKQAFSISSPLVGGQVSERHKGARRD
jgi:hypothetical protein